MIYFKNEFLSHLDILNKIVYGKSFNEASCKARREMFSVWNLPSFNGMLAVSELVENGFNCKVINNFDAELDVLEELGKLSENPVIGISSTFILQWNEIGRIAAKIRELVPHAIIVVGGAFVNDQFISFGKQSFEKYMKKYGLNYIIFSFNSERDLLQLINVLKVDGDFTSVNNLAYFDRNGQYLTTEDCRNEPTLDYPPQAWSRLYSRETMGSTLQLRTSSGCPFNCAFCTYPVTAGSFSMAEVAEFERQLAAIHALGNIKSVMLIDDTPNVPLYRFRQLVKVFKRYSFKWYSFLRVQYMDEELAKDMAESGCEGVYLGIESANDGVLSAMNKQVAAADYRRGIEILRRNGIVTLAAFVLGFPGETEVTVQDNIKFIQETGLDFYSLKEFYYSHAAAIHDQREKYNLSGQGNVWKHNTMSSVEASVQKLRMFESVKSAVYVDADSGLWYLAYLRECGFTWPEIRGIQREISEMMSQDNRGDFFSKDPHASNLKGILDQSKFKGGKSNACCL
jgi:p-methyltransferase